MEKNELYSLIKDSKEPNEQTLLQLEKLLEKYPFFQTARLLYTKNLCRVSSPLYDQEMGRTSILCASRNRLFYLIGDELFARFFRRTDTGETRGKDRTEELLDSFLSTMPEKEASEPEPVHDAVKSIIASDYMLFLETQHPPTTPQHDDEPNNLLKHHDIIDSFIGKVESNEIFVSAKSDSESITASENQHNDADMGGDEFLTETLARIYIRQKKYKQALAIIRRLSLNFPEKSVYFADQIRFLEYLIINEKNK